MSCLRLRGVGACFWLGLSACSRSDPAPAPAQLPPEIERELSTATAFDLTSAAGGAVLAWAPPLGGVLLTARFDARGLALQRPRVDAGASATRAGATPAVSGEGWVSGVGRAVADLAVVESAESLALAWNEGEGGTGQLRVAWLPPRGSARTFDLGPAWRGSPSQRGALALGAREAGALLLARGVEAPCASSDDEGCHSFQFFRFSGDGAYDTGIPLTVPSPCAEWSAQLVSAPARALGGALPDASNEEAPARFDYAICSGEGAESALTVFSIVPQPAYATAEETFRGCTPLGAGHFAGAPAFVATCGLDRRIVTLPVQGGRPVVRTINERGLVCNGGTARLRFGAEWLRPSGPLGRLELLLTEDLAPPGARAVWTGEALVVARADAGRLVLSRHACQGSSLVELEGPFEAGS
jgi:hypothetical protein